MEWDSIVGTPADTTVVDDLYSRGARAGVCQVPGASRTTSPSFGTAPALQPQWQLAPAGYSLNDLFTAVPPEVAEAGLSWQPFVKVLPENSTCAIG